MGASQSRSRSRSCSRSNNHFAQSPASHIPEQFPALATIPLMVVILTVVEIALATSLLATRPAACKADEDQVYNYFNYCGISARNLAIWVGGLSIGVFYTVSTVFYTIIAEIPPYHIYNYWVMLFFWVSLFLINNFWFSWYVLAATDSRIFFLRLGLILQAIQQSCTFLYTILFGISVIRHKRHGGASKFNPSDRANQDINLPNRQPAAPHGPNPSVIHVNVNLPQHDGGGSEEAPPVPSAVRDIPRNPPGAPRKPRSRTNPITGVRQHPLATRSADSFASFPNLDSAIMIV